MSEVLYVHTTFFLATGLCLVNSILSYVTLSSSFQTISQISPIYHYSLSLTLPSLSYLRIHPLLLLAVASFKCISFVSRINHPGEAGHSSLPWDSHSISPLLSAASCTLHRGSVKRSILVQEKLSIHSIRPYKAPQKRTLLWVKLSSHWPNFFSGQWVDSATHS